MKLALELCGKQGAPVWQGEPKYELWHVTSDVITEELARDLSTRLSAGTEGLVVNDPILSDNGQAAVIEIRSEASSVHLRGQTWRIRRIAEEMLEPLGVEVPRH